jgi:hypothetical protein
VVTKVLNADPRAYMKKDVRSIPEVMHSGSSNSTQGDAISTLSDMIWSKTRQLDPKFLGEVS